MRQDGRPAIFIDRDGTINHRLEGRYVTRWVEFVFLPGVLDALRCLTRAGFALVAVSNQAGVGKGLLKDSALAEIHRQMAGAITRAGGRLDGIYVCPHLPEDDCACRKPRPGLLLRAVKELGIDLTSSYIVGDSLSDIEAGRAAGCRTILIGNGLVSSESGAAPCRTVPNLLAAAELILGETRAPKPIWV